MGGLSNEKSDLSDLGLPLVWERMLRGDHKSFEKVYHHAFPKLYQYGCRITAEDVVEEVIQELFIHIWNKRDDLPKVSSPIAYLFSSFRNRLINHISRHRQHRVMPLDLVPDFRYQLNEEKDWADYGDLLQQAVNKLSHQQREVIYLLYFNDLSAAEVAEILSLKVRTVYNTAHNALQMLRHHLQQDSSVFYLIPAGLLLGFLL